MSNKKDVLAFGNPNTLKSRVPHSSLQIMHEILSDAVSLIYDLSCHRARRVDYKFKRKLVAPGSLADAIDIFFPSGESRNVRIVLVDGNVRIDWPSNAHPDGLVVGMIDRNSSWNLLAEDSNGALFLGDSRKYGTLTYDVLIDNAMARSEGIAPIIDRFVARYDVSKLLQAKSEFLKTEGLSQSPYYGKIDERAYCSFCAALRSHSDLNLAAHIDRTIDLWDKFIETRLENFMLPANQIRSDLLNIAKYWGQLPYDLGDLFEGSGSFVVVRPKSKHATPQVKLDRMAETFQISDWLPRNIFVRSISDLKKEGKWDYLLQQVIRGNFANAFRCYVR